MYASNILLQSDATPAMRLHKGKRGIVDSNLSQADKSACGQLDDDISAAEKREQTATGEQLQTIQIQLFQLRKEYKNLRC